MSYPVLMSSTARSETLNTLSNQKLLSATYVDAIRHAEQTLRSPHN